MSKIKKNTQIYGLIGLVLLIFALMIALVVDYDPFFLLPIHFGLGFALVVLFFIRGGISVLSSAAAKRAAGLGTGAILYSLLFLALLIAINIASSRKEFWHFDSTEQKVFTLAPQTEKVLNSLPERVIVRAFFIGGKAEPKSIEDLLNRLKKASENFSFQIIDPEKQATMTEKYGVSQTGTLHFSFDRPDSTREVKIVRDINEQEIVNAILKLTRGSEKIVYSLTGHGEGNIDGEKEAGFKFLKEAIQGENINIQNLVLANTKEVPADANALLVLAPRRALLPEELLALDAYLRRGGNVLFLNESDSPEDIAKVVRPLGIEIGKDMVVDQMVRLFAGPSLGVQPMVTDYGKHPITENFTEGTIYSTVSSVRANTSLQDAVNFPGTVSELAFTSANGWAETNLQVLLGENPQATLDPEDIKGPVPIGAAFEGKPREENKASASRVVVLGDVDFVANVNLRQLYNRDFFLNCLNWVLGQDQGVSIREKTMRRSTAGLTLEQFGSMFALTGVVLPEFVLLVGLIVWWRRKQ